MTRERWQQVCDLLERALELAPEQRPALLDQACGADRFLRQEVEVLKTRYGNVCLVVDAANPAGL